MKILPLLAACAALFLSATGRADVANGAYVGTSRTVVNYLDPATFQTVATETYRRKVGVRIGNPKRAGRFIEQNPFSLTIAPLAPDRALPGALYAASAQPFTVNGAPILLQYWLLDETRAGFEGALVNNHRAENLARDVIVALLGGPGGSRRNFILHDGSIGSALQCQIAATATGRVLNITVAGYAFAPGQAIIQFRTTIASRRL